MEAVLKTRLMYRQNGGFAMYYYEYYYQYEMKVDKPAHDEKMKDCISGEFEDIPQLIELDRHTKEQISKKRSTESDENSCKKQKTEELNRSLK